MLLWREIAVGVAAVECGSFSSRKGIGEDGSVGERATLRDLSARDGLLWKKEDFGSEGEVTLRGVDRNLSRRPFGGASSTEGLSSWIGRTV